MTHEQVDDLTPPERAAAILYVFSINPGAQMTEDEIYTALEEVSRGTIIRLMQNLQEDASMPGWRKGEYYNP